MDEFYNKHYIQTDERGFIISGWSDGPHPEIDTSEAICINEQGGYQFRLTPDGEENPSLCTMDGVPLYLWDGERVIPRTAEDIEANRPAVDDTPTELEQLKANVDFMMAMWGMNIEGGNNLASN